MSISEKAQRASDNDRRSVDIIRSRQESRQYKRQYNGRSNPQHSNGRIQKGPSENVQKRLRRERIPAPAATKRQE